METIALQIRVKEAVHCDIFRTPRFYGKLEGGTELLVVSENGNCHIYQVKDIEGYKQFVIDNDQLDYYKFQD